MYIKTLTLHNTHRNTFKGAVNVYDGNKYVYSLSAPIVRLTSEDALKDAEELMASIALQNGVKV